MRFEALIVLVLAPLACNTPPKEAHDSAAATSTATVAISPPASSTPPAPAAPAPSSGSGSASCTKDDDCRTFSSYCAEAPCACRVVSPSDPEPKCLGGAPSSVRCFVDPCMGKKARCQSGTCALTVK